jgi:hypothetical protein
MPLLRLMQLDHGRLRDPTVVTGCRLEMPVSRGRLHAESQRVLLAGKIDLGQRLSEMPVYCGAPALLASNSAPANHTWSIAQPRLPRKQSRI